MILIFSWKGYCKRINQIHEKYFKLILNDYESSFVSLLSTLDEKTIHQRCINVLLTEVYKYLNGYSPDLKNEVFYLRQNLCILRSFNVLTTDNPLNKYFCLLSEPTLANSIPSEIKRAVHHCSSLKVKSKLGAVSISDVLARCQCQICSRYSANVGYF